MNDQRLIELLTKKHSGELTLPERIELLELEKAQTNSAATIALVDEVFRSKISFENSVNPKIQQYGFARVSERIGQQGSAPKSGELKFLKYLKYVAAAVLLIAVVGTLFWASNPISTNVAQQQVVSTEKGSKSKVILPDGTKVWLNVDTKLTYAPLFGKTTREVTLVGEAYFDVIEDKSRPFIVHTESMDVKVLGTAFNVRSYENEKMAQTTLLRGKVDVVLKNQGNQDITLNPNEKITVRNTSEEGKSLHVAKDIASAASGPVFIKSNLNPADSSVYETGWVNDRLVFRYESFSEIIAALERWYNVKITVARIPKGKKFRGTFQNDSLEDVLKAFQASAGIKYKIENDSVIIF